VNTVKGKPDSPRHGVFLRSSSSSPYKKGRNLFGDNEGESEGEGSESNLHTFKWSDESSKPKAKRESPKKTTLFTKKTLYT